MKRITVIGGGSSAHVLIPLLAKTGMEVRLLTRKPGKWIVNPSLDYIEPSGRFINRFEGGLDDVSSSPEDVIPGSDIIILCLPVHVYRLMLHKIAPFIDKNRGIYIGTVYGQGGFNWMVDEIKRKFMLQNLKPFAFGLIPWICRTGEYGKRGIVYGAKPINVVATDTNEDFEELNEGMLDQIVYKAFGHGRFNRASNFLSLTMSLDNQIIHTSRLYGLYLESNGKWKSKAEVPLFYKDFSKISARILKGLDGDYSKIRKRIRNKFKDRKFEYMLDYITLDNRTNLRHNRTYLDTFRNSTTLGAIETPVVEKNGMWVLDETHRFFKDDVFYGLCIAKSIAEMFGVRTYHIDKTLYWAQRIMGESLIENYRLQIRREIRDKPMKYGIPEVYGIFNAGGLVG